MNGGGGEGKEEKEEAGSPNMRLADDRRSGTWSHDPGKAGVALAAQGRPASVAGGHRAGPAPAATCPPPQPAGHLGPPGPRSPTTTMQAQKATKIPR